MRTLSALALVLLIAGACAGEPPPAPVVPTPPPPVAPPPPPAARDQCGAELQRHLVGRPRREIPVPVLPALQRVACTTCPVTLDHNPRRLNFFYDAETGIIEEIRCG